MAQFKTAKKRGNTFIGLNLEMRIFSLVTDAYGAGGGISQYNRDLFAELSAVEEIGEIVVLPRNGSACQESMPSKVRQLTAIRGKTRYAFAALKVARSEGPFDAVLCGHLHMAPLAALVSRITDAPLWLQLHGIEAWQVPGPVRRWAAERAQLVTAVSRHTRRLFLSWANCKPEAVRVLPNTVEERFTPGPKPNDLLDRFRLRGKKVLLTVSRLAASERYKGHDRVIEALAMLKASHPEIAYLVAGDGDDRPRLERLADQVGVAGQVRFVGFVLEDELSDLYRAADVFVMPSTGEGFGIVFLQALASGVPVIGGDGDGSRDPLRDGVDGRMVAANEVSAVASAINEMLRADRQPHGAGNAFSRPNFAAMVAGIVRRLPHEGA